LPVLLRSKHFPVLELVTKSPMRIR
jgi:hypothetical protein